MKPAGGQAPDWFYDGLKQVGTDFENPDAVAACDRNQRTRETDDAALLERLDVGPGMVVIDIGTGTGSLPRAAARRGARVFAVDVSAAMLAYAEGRARTEGLSGITFRRAGDVCP